jgi:hypothetical protein
MRLSPEQSSYLAARERFLRWWPAAGIALLGSVLGLGVWLWVSVPTLVSPWACATRLQDGSLAEGTLVLMAGMLPVAMLLLLGFLVAALLLAFAAFRNEGRLLRMVRALTETEDAGWGD